MSMKTFDEFIAEWPTERVRDFFVENKRAACKFYATKLKDLQTLQKDARRNGVSYAERSTYPKKIQALITLFNQTKQEGMEYKQNPPHIEDLLNPEDEQWIREVGVEKYLQFHYL